MTDGRGSAAGRPSEGIIDLDQPDPRWTRDVCRREIELPEDRVPLHAAGHEPMALVEAGCRCILRRRSKPAPHAMEASAPSLCEQVRQQSRLDGSRDDPTTQEERV